ncbi:MAG: DUF4136 domain-containing protein [Luteimonas sp.]
MRGSRRFTIHLITRYLIGLIGLVVLAGCVSGPRVRTDFDPEADFSRYHRYAFYQPLAMEESGYSSYMTDRIKAGIRREMDARGYVFDEQAPDLRVNFQGIVQDKTEVYSVPRSDVNYFYNYRARRYFGVPFWYDETQVSQFREGTLTVDVVDAARNRLVWTGAAIGRVTGRTPQDRANEADRALGSIFMQYPYRTGSGEGHFPQAAPAR